MPDAAEPDIDRPRAPHRTDLRAHLKAETSQTHQALDERLGGLPLETRCGYVDFLTVIALATLPLEGHLEAYGMARLLPDWPARRRTAAIIADLTRLAIVTPAPIGTQALEPLSRDAHLWGMAYVLEGSRLGGRVLLNRLAKGAPTECLDATAYLTHGQSAGHWPTFLQALAAATPDAAAMKAGAGAAFTFFHAAADSVLDSQRPRKRH